MEEERAGAHGGVAGEGNEEDSVMAMLKAGLDAQQREEDKEAVCNCVNDLCRQGGKPVVFFAPIYRAGYGQPSACIGIALGIWDRGKPGRHIERQSVPRSRGLIWSC